jgi:CRP-like cAMP-binding protein
VALFLIGACVIISAGLLNGLWGLLAAGAVLWLVAETCGSVVAKLVRRPDACDHPHGHSTSLERSAPPQPMSPDAADPLDPTATVGAPADPAATSPVSPAATGPVGPAAASPVGPATSGPVSPTVTSPVGTVTGGSVGPAVGVGGSDVGFSCVGAFGGVSGGFWGALRLGQREALERKGVPRTYAAGTAIFREGEPADHVVIVMEGRAKICKQGPGGRSLLLAIRGPGEILGERGALVETRPRSATVIAVADVRALMVATRDFKAFIEHYPDVLDLLEGEIYGRLTQMGEALSQPVGSPDGRGRTEEPSRVDAVMVRDETILNGDTCTVLLSDVAGFSGEERNEDDRLFVRRMLNETMRNSFDKAHIPWESCHREDRGDGLLIVVPPHTPTTAILESLPGRVAIELSRHNRRVKAAGYIQLRLAMAVGPVRTDGTGVSGDALIEAARLIELRAFKRRLKTERADLGLIGSAYIHQAMIKTGAAAVVPGAYRRVRGRVKGTTITGWATFHPAA